MNLKNTVEDHEKRIETLETIVGGMQENFTALSNDVVRVSNDVMKVQTGQAELAKGQKDIEVTMVKEGQANRDVIAETKKIADKLLDHVIEKDTVLTKAEQKRKDKQALSDAEIRKTRWEIIGKISVALVGGTSVIAVIIQAIF